MAEMIEDTLKEICVEELDRDYGITGGLANKIAEEAVSRMIGEIWHVQERHLAETIDEVNEKRDDENV